MRNTNLATLVPPAQAEAIYDLSLDEEIETIAEPNNQIKVDWPHPATDGRVPQRALFESPVRRTNKYQTSP